MEKAANFFMLISFSLYGIMHLIFVSAGIYAVFIFAEMLWVLIFGGAISLNYAQLGAMIVNTILLLLFVCWKSAKELGKWFGFITYTNEMGKLRKKMKKSE